MVYIKAPNLTIERLLNTGVLRTSEFRTYNRIVKIPFDAGSTGENSSRDGDRRWTRI